MDNLGTPMTSETSQVLASCFIMGVKQDLWYVTDFVKMTPLNGLISGIHHHSLPWLVFVAADETTMPAAAGHWKNIDWFFDSPSTTLYIPKETHQGYLESLGSSIYLQGGAPVVNGQKNPMKTIVRDITNKNHIVKLDFSVHQGSRVHDLGHHPVWYQTELLDWFKHQPPVTLCHCAGWHRSLCDVTKCDVTKCR